MREIKKNDVVQVLALRCKVLQREGVHCLVEVQEPYHDRTWLDIGRIGHSGDYDTETLSLLGANTHIEGNNPGGITTQLPDDVVRAKYDALVAKIKKEADNRAEAAKRATETADKRMSRIQDYKGHRAELAVKLREMVAGMKASDAIKDKEFLKLVAQMNVIDAVLTNTKF